MVSISSSGSFLTLRTKGGSNLLLTFKQTPSYLWLKQILLFQVSWNSVLKKTTCIIWAVCGIPNNNFLWQISKPVHGAETGLTCSDPLSHTLSYFSKITLAQGCLFIITFVIWTVLFNYVKYRNFMYRRATGN